MPSRFRKLSKSKTAARENSSILTRAVAGRRGGVHSQRCVILLWPRCHFEGDKVMLCCCCKLPFSLLAIVHIVHCAAC